MKDRLKYLLQIQLLFINLTVFPTKDKFIRFPLKYFGCKLVFFLHLLLCYCASPLGSRSTPPFTWTTLLLLLLLLLLLHLLLLLLLLLHLLLLLLVQRWSADEARVLRVSVNSFLDHLSLVVETMELFGPPVDL
uniref:Uncharacterized protein n=1 Tax=Poecilia reticulata TaxID=8081 RepID=A0A3P9PC38_POERE